MPYATPSQYISKFGLTEAVQLLADEERLLTAPLLQDAIAGAWTGAPSPAEQDAATAALARLVRQLAASSNFIDGYLRAAVTLPLSESDANAGTLEDCCLALARCGLADDSDNATERMSKTCETWRAWLRDIAAGRVHLAGEAGTAPPSAARYRSGQAVSAFDWARHGGSV
jgi:phage gp36-like protein